MAPRKDFFPVLVLTLPFLQLKKLTGTSRKHISLKIPIPFGTGRFPTFMRSCLLLSGPFHCTMTLPRSNKNTSPTLKLSQLTSTYRIKGGVWAQKGRKRSRPIAMRGQEGTMSLLNLPGPSSTYGSSRACYSILLYFIVLLTVVSPSWALHSKEGQQLNLI